MDLAEIFCQHKIRGCLGDSFTPYEIFINKPVLTLVEMTSGIINKTVTLKSIIEVYDDTKLVGKITIQQSIDKKITSLSFTPESHIPLKILE